MKGFRCLKPTMKEKMKHLQNLMVKPKHLLIHLHLKMGSPKQRGFLMRMVKVKLKNLLKRSNLVMLTEKQKNLLKNLGSPMMKEKQKMKNLRFRLSLVKSIYSLNLKGLPKQKVKRKPKRSS